MRLTLVCMAVAVLALAGSVAAHDPPSGRYVVNLDLPPAARWTFLKDYQSPIQKLHQWIESIVPKEIMDWLLHVAADLDKYLPGEYGEELRGVADAVDMPLGMVVALNLVYDASCYCTSIVTGDNDGMMWHARNLDYPIPYLQNITIQLDFQSKGQTLYQGTTFAGYVGLLTGMKKGVFSVTVDQRDTANGTLWDNLYELLFRDGQSIGFFLRDSLANSTSYEAAVTHLQTTHLIAPVYLIVSGPRFPQGAVITRDRDTQYRTWYLEDSQWNWFLLETNYDLDKEPPARDNRRAAAVKAMNNMTQSRISVDSLYQVLSTPPVFNRGTRYSVVMRVADGFAESWERWSAADLPPRRGDWVDRFYAKLSNKPAMPIPPLP